MGQLAIQSHIGFDFIDFLLAKLVSNLECSFSREKKTMHVTG